MPHSSGGGSHGGGFHGGSHHGGHGGSGSHARITTTHFPGASRYVYYRNNRPHYYYSNYNPSKKPSKAVIAAYLISASIVLSFTLYSLVLLLMMTQPIHGAKGSTRIDDQLHILSSSEAAVLEDELEHFKTRTGIPVYFLTVTHETWQSDYPTLEKYAYDFYVKTLPDEKSWLIVYSQPDSPDFKWLDWRFEGMQGDDTDRVLNSSITRNFNLTVYRLLADSKEFNVGKSFADAFHTITPQTLKSNVKGTNWILLLYLLLPISFGIWMIYTAIKKIRIYQKYQGSVKCPAAKMTKEVTCSFCKGVYVEGTVHACPHCGTAIHKE